MADKTTVSAEKVWMKYYPPEVRNATPPSMKVYTYLKENNRHRLHEAALYYYGTKITVKRLIERIDECADAFDALGVKKGDVVSLLSASTPESIIAFYALNKIGAVINAIDPRLDTKSISRMIQNSGSSVLLMIEAAYPKVTDILPEIGQRHMIVQSVSTSLPPMKRWAVSLATRSQLPYGEYGMMSWDAFIGLAKQGRAVEADYEGDATVAITYTGGTTGFPKGVMLTNDSVNAVAYSFIHAGILHKDGQRFLGIMPIFSSYGLVCGIHMPLTIGCELALIPRFYPQKMGEYVKRFKPAHMIATPAFYEILIDSREMKNFDLSFMLTMGSGGDTMNAGLEAKLETFIADHGIRYPLAQGYGMSEVSAAATFCVNDRYKKGSVGIPCVATTIGIFDPETGDELSYGESGEVCITGPTVMKGYYNNKEETDHIMRRHADGRVWIHSGDIGRIDEDGFVYIQGRVKRMITRFDGHKVFPITIESFICEHESVHSCSVIAVDDREHSQGQYPMAVVELVSGLDTGERDRLCREIYRRCLEQLEERGRPVAVVCVSEIPLTGAGKNDYRALEKEFRYFDYRAWQKDAE